jgi:hypothetical protein
MFFVLNAKLTFAGASSDNGPWKQQARAEFGKLWADLFKIPHVSPLQILVSLFLLKIRNRMIELRFDIWKLKIIRRRKNTNFASEMKLFCTREATKLFVLDYVLEML